VKDIQDRGMVLAAILKKDPSFDKSHHISIESVGHIGTVDGNTRLDLNTEIAVNIERLKIIRKECPDMWKICDVQLIDPNAVEYFSELNQVLKMARDQPQGLTKTILISLKSHNHQPQVKLVTIQI